MFDAGSPRPAPRKSNNTSAPSHGYPGSPAPAPAPVHLPPSKGRGQGNSAHAPRHPNQYHSPPYSPGYLLLITLPFVLAATNVPAMPPRNSTEQASPFCAHTNMLKFGYV